MEEETKFVEAGFCDECVAESTDKTPGDISTTNGVGRKFYGGAQPCAQCGSVIRTLWWCFIDLPLIPLGSYRYITVSDDEVQMSRFWTRSTATNWGQILKTWAVGLVIGAVVIGAIVYYESNYG